MPKTMQVSIVSIKAINKLPLDMLTMAEIRTWPRPVIVTTPAMIPATPQAMATEIVFFVPFSNTVIKPLGVMRVSLRNILTTMATKVAMTAERAIVKPAMTIQTRMIKGNSK